MKNSKKPLFSIEGEGALDKINEMFPVDKDLEIPKELVAEALVPIMDCIRNESNTIKKKKCYELVKAFVDTYHNEVVDALYEVFKEYGKGATMYVSVKTDSNPYRPYRICDVDFDTDYEDDRGSFGIVVLDEKNNKGIVMGRFSYCCQVDKDYLERLMSDLEKSAGEQTMVNYQINMS